MTIHNREPCFFCEHREREPGQVLCSVCIAWAEVVRGGEVYQRTLQTVNEIEHMLRMYDVPIMLPSCGAQRAARAHLVHERPPMWLRPFPGLHDVFGRRW